MRRIISYFGLAWIAIGIYTLIDSASWSWPDGEAKTYALGTLIMFTFLIYFFPGLMIFGMFSKSRK